MIASTLVGLNEETITRHAKDVTTKPKNLLYKTRVNESHLSKVGPQREIVDGLLK